MTFHITFRPNLMVTSYATRYYKPESHRDCLIVAVAIAEIERGRRATVREIRIEHTVPDILYGNPLCGTVYTYMLDTAAELSQYIGLHVRESYFVRPNRMTIRVVIDPVTRPNARPAPEMEPESEMETELGMGSEIEMTLEPRLAP